MQVPGSASTVGDTVAAVVEAAEPLAYCRKVMLAEDAKSGSIAPAVKASPNVQQVTLKDAHSRLLSPQSTHQSAQEHV